MRILLLCAVLLAASGARAETRKVGPGQAYAKPCQAFAAAQDGDTIEIDAAGSYDGDVCAITKNRLSIQGVNGRPHIKAAGKSSGGKGTWVIQGSDTTVWNIELSGAAVPDKNGAGIRQEGRNLHVGRCYFHDNENGILTGADAQSAIVIEGSEFARNGAGDGYSHNMYIGQVASFTLRGSYSHHAKVGHLVKSRALRNVIEYNRLTDETGTASYELDLPQGGPSYVIGNLIQQSADTSNGGFLAYAREGERNPGSALWVVNNTFFNARSAGTFVGVAADVTTVVLRNNIFAGPGTVTDATSAVNEANFVGDAKFTDAATYDYRLTAGSPAIDHGVDPGTGGSQSLLQECQFYVLGTPLARERVGVIDQGALEFGNTGTRACGDGPELEPPGLQDAGTPSDAGLDAQVVDARVPVVLDGAIERDAGALADASASRPTKGDDGCQSASAGAQLWVAVGLLLLALRRRYALR